MDFYLTERQEDKIIEAKGILNNSLWLYNELVLEYMNLKPRSPLDFECSYLFNNENNTWCRCYFCRQESLRFRIREIKIDCWYHLDELNRQIYKVSKQLPAKLIGKKENGIETLELECNYQILNN